MAYCSIVKSKNNPEFYEIDDRASGKIAMHTVHGFSEVGLEPVGTSIEHSTVDTRLDLDFLKLGKTLY
jgi:hypothetical protein